ncbi:MAG: glucosyl-3-phosphoglycerate synthase [Solirubrobacterales bacterium]
MAGEERTAALERALQWARERTFEAGRYTASSLAEVKGERSVSVVIPVKEAALTVGRVAASCMRLREAGAVDQVLVIDADSADGSAEFAAQAGAEVRQEAALIPSAGPVKGKGDALWRSLSVATGEIIVFVDSDTEGFSESFVCGLVGPLLEEASLQMVKGAFDRPFTSAGVRIEGGGGRVNELVARPLLNTYFPELAAVRQPLAGELAARREALASVPFRTGYGVEIALLIDFYERFGLAGIAQSDLGERLNRHQHLHELAPMAFAVQRALMARVEGGDVREPSDEFLGYFEGEPELRTIPAEERPPLDAYSGGASDGA